LVGLRVVAIDPNIADSNAAGSLRPRATVATCPGARKRPLANRRSVAGVIEWALQAAEVVRSAGRPTNDLTAYDVHMPASRGLFWRGHRRDDRAD
jgi:hypothetical protein